MGEISAGMVKAMGAGYAVVGTAKGEDISERMMR